MLDIASWGVGVYVGEYGWYDEIRGVVLGSWFLVSETGFFGGRGCICLLHMETGGLELACSE